MAQVMSMTLLQCAVSGSSSHRAEQELVDLDVPPPNADNLLCLLESSRQMHITEDREGRKSSIAASAKF